MLYLNEKDLIAIGKDWSELAGVIGDATQLIFDNDFAQPLKPYLRYRNMNNRIIAMPAFVGGAFGMAGIKWIASFPANIDQGMNRAHSVTILNEADTGRPLSIINTTLISAIRTAAVSGYFIREIVRRRNAGKKYIIGISGFGIIGRTHLEMIAGILGEQLGSVYVYDIRPAVLEGSDSAVPGINVVRAESWQQAYVQADIFIACTVSKERYIDLPPKPGSLQLNVSLRDYTPAVAHFMDYIFVDNWEEVCRENTDIERMHLQHGLQRVNTMCITDLLDDGIALWADAPAVVMFNPMGMAVYDIAVSAYYHNKAIENGLGVDLQ